MRKNELREILDAVLRELDGDPSAASRMRAAAPLRLEFPDLNLALNLFAAEGGGLRWDFARRCEERPKLRLRMDSDEANRLLQGRDSAAIAIVRGRLDAKAEDASAALRFFGAVKLLVSGYRSEIAERHPHLVLD
ncbi:MAG: hypothetical protein ACRDKH_02680 [Solirubrobacterales bacterium]